MCVDAKAEAAAGCRPGLWLELASLLSNNSTACQTSAMCADTQAEAAAAAGYACFDHLAIPTNKPSFTVCFHDHPMQMPT
jgi:hypothetical protein